MTKESLLKFVKFSNTKQWNAKSFFGTTVKSKFSVDSIGKHTIHITKKTKLFEEPDKEFRILGISNEIGMFDAYTELGKNINQPYIKVEDGYIAYNPYRVNVGSIGLKSRKLENDYISPAYVVIKCKSSILPEYLYLVLKSSVFNQFIRENTTGSVRQTLSYDKLANINIPVPPISIQKQTISKYKLTINVANDRKRLANKTEKDIDKYLCDVLKIEPLPKYKEVSYFLKKTTLKGLLGWGAKLNCETIKPYMIFYSNGFENKPLNYYCELNPTTVIPDSEDISFIPMECISDTYGEILELRKGNSNETKGYTKFKENDVLWAKITPCMQNGKCAVAKGLTNGYGYGSTEYHVFRTKDNMMPEFLYCFLRTQRVREIAKSYFTGSAGQQRVGSDFLSALTLPNIPIHSENADEITQEKIVAKIFELKSQIKKLNQEAEELKKQAYKEFEEAVFGE